VQVQSVAHGADAAQSRNPPLFLYGVLLILVGLGIYACGIVFSVVRILTNLGEHARRWNEALVWYSGAPFTVGAGLIALDLALLLPRKRRRSQMTSLGKIVDRRVVVALTAYNDEESIAAAVADFRSHGTVSQVIVVDNNSRDGTAAAARAAGAVVVVETKPGYGRCVYRCFQEALARSDSQLIVLC